jgi:4-amino-4-deoxy-L-arabinose transferase-like glycosyltransferase
LSPERADGAPRAAPRGSWLASAEATAAIALIALLPRLFVAIGWAREPVWDGHYYDFGAQRVADGLGYSADRATPHGVVWQPWCHYPVGYSGFLAIAYAIFGGGPHVGPVANALVGAGLAAVVHRLALRVTTERRAIVAGLIAALAPPLVVYAPLLMTEPLAALGLVAAPAAYLGVRRRGRWPALVCAGAVLGLATLVRPQSLVCAPALALFAWSEEEGAPRLRRARIAVVAALVATAACLAVVAPWTARNCRVMDGCALVSTNGGWNLAIGAGPRATGRFEALHASDGCREVTGQVQQDRCWRRMGLAWIAADPARWIALAPAKLAYTFDHQSFAIGYLAEADPTSWPEERKAWWRRLLTVSSRVLLVAAAVGMVGLPRARGRRAAPRVAALALVASLALLAGWPEVGHAWPLAVAIPLLGAARRAVGPALREGAGGAVVAYLAFVIASTCAVHAVFFGEDRYQIVVMPALAVLAALALARAPSPAR